MGSAVPSPVVRPFGDRAVTVEFEHRLSPAVNARARALARRLRDLPGVLETVPTLRSVLVVCDFIRHDPGRLTEQIRCLAARLPAERGEAGRLIDMPVTYGGPFGPDLEEVAATHGLTPADVIRLHSAEEYVVYMLGFAPGFPYLGALPDAIRTPRLPSPRLRVPPGSVGIADALTGIYPLQTAGGWRLIGRTPRLIYDPNDADPVLLRPGDRVRFVPVDHSEFPALSLGRATPLRVQWPAFEVIEPGLYTTVQDMGRPGYRSLGVPAAGAMDPPSLVAGNTIVGNSAGTPALECTAPGPVLRALDHVTIAVTGAVLSPTIDGTPLEMWTAVSLRPGQTLAFGAPRAGMWAYVAVAGGIDVSQVLGSASTYVPGGLGGSAGRRARAGDVFGRGEGARRSPGRTVRPLPVPGGEVTIRVIPGPQDALFLDEERMRFWQRTCEVTVHADRAGVRLSGPGIASGRAVEFLSDGLLPGAIQVPPGGDPIVIMPDGPTTGGYPKMGVVASADLRLVAQARPGTRIRFMPTTVEEAIEALPEMEPRDQMKG